MDKRTIYSGLLEELKAMLEPETDPVTILSNAAALLHERMGFFWTGFYGVRPDGSGGEELLLGPFQGPPACMHIACSARARSEIVVPLFHPGTGAVLGVLDIDSEQTGTFDAADAEGLGEICLFLAEKCC